MASDCSHLLQLPIELANLSTRMCCCTPRRDHSRYKHAGKCIMRHTNSFFSDLLFPEASQPCDNGSKECRLDTFVML